jgi:hypothetical protein
LASIINASNSGFGGIVSTGDSSGVLQLQTAATTAVTIDTSQNVGIGTSSFALSAAGRGDLEIAGSSTAVVGLKGGSNQSYIYNDGTSVYIANNSASGNIVFQPASYAESMRITSAGLLQFNSGYGSVATAYGCRAWVNFNGTLTGTITPRASGNVTSVTKNGTGDYTVNFTNAMPDANYAPAIATQRNGINSAVWGSVKYNSTMLTTSVTIATVDVSPTAQDPIGVFVSIFR